VLNVLDHGDVRRKRRAGDLDRLVSRAKLVRRVCDETNVLDEHFLLPKAARSGLLLLNDDNGMEHDVGDVENNGAAAANDDDAAAAATEDANHQKKKKKKKPTTKKKTKNGHVLGGSFPPTTRGSLRSGGSNKKSDDSDDKAADLFSPPRKRRPHAEEPAPLTTLNANLASLGALADLDGLFDVLHGTAERANDCAGDAVNYLTASPKRKRKRKGPFGSDPPVFLFPEICSYEHDVVEEDDD